MYFSAFFSILYFRSRVRPKKPRKPAFKPHKNGRKKPRRNARKFSKMRLIW